MRTATETELKSGTLFEVAEKDGTPVWTRFVGARHHGRFLALEQARLEQAEIVKIAVVPMGPGLKWEPRREVRAKGYVLDDDY